MSHATAGGLGGREGGGEGGVCVCVYLQSWESCQSDKHPQPPLSQLLPYSLLHLQNNVYTSPLGPSNVYRTPAEADLGVAGWGGGVCVYGYLRSWESCQSDKHPQPPLSLLPPYSLLHLQNNVCTSPLGPSNVYSTPAEADPGVVGGGGVV